MDKLTINDIARELGLSKTTVSRALSGKGRISQDTRARVMEYAARAGYGAPRQTHNISLVIPPEFVRLDLPFLRRCMGGVCRTAQLRGYDVLLCYADETSVESLQRQLSARKSDGVILTRPYTGDPCLDLLRRFGTPFVAIGRMDAPDILQVDNDNLGAARELTSVLLRSGLRRIAYFGGDLSYPVNADRLSGFLRALAERGIEPDPALLLLDMVTQEQREEAIGRLLEMRADALLCGDDSLTLFAMRQLALRGIRVPEQLRVACLFDSEQLAFSPVSVTAAQFDTESLAASACRLLLDRLAGKKTFPVVRQGYQLVLRESTK